MATSPDRLDPSTPTGPAPGALLLPDPFECAAPEDEAADLWVVTYMDVLTLLLTFFVVVVAYTGFARPERLETSGAAAGPGSERSAGVAGRAGIDEGVEAGAAPEAGPLARAAAGLTRRLDARGLGAAAEIRVHPDHAGVEIEDRILFPVGRAELGLRGREVLRILAPVLRETDLRISVEGHTDDLPISTERFPSNWALSAARAAAVVRYLARQGVDPARLRAVGYADTRPRVPNDGPRERARNRRVTLVLHLPPEPGAGVP